MTTTTLTPAHTTFIKALKFETVIGYKPTEAYAVAVNGRGVGYVYRVLGTWHFHMPASLAGGFTMECHRSYPTQQDAAYALQAAFIERNPE